MSCSFTACPFHCPRGLLLTRRGNTWSLLCFKWLLLTLRSPLGVRLSHFVSRFPTEARSREASVRSVLRETLETRHSSLLNPGWRYRSTQGDHLSAPTSAAGVYLKKATPGSGLSALRCGCCKSRPGISSSGGLIPDLHRPGLVSHVSLLDCVRSNPDDYSRNPTEEVQLRVMLVWPWS